MSNAWCMLVMLNPEYIMGALVCAKSLKNVNTQYPIICMITQDILDALPTAIEILSHVFDDVVLVPIIEHPVVEFKAIRQKEMYGHWINKSFTKWNCLTLVSSETGSLFDKVILLDVDMIMLTNCDELFELQAPAGCFSQPWAYPYQKHHAAPNPYIKCSKKWLAQKDIPHGATIKADVIMTAICKSESIHSGSDAYTAAATFTVGGFILLLKPSLEDYNYLLEEIIQKVMPYGKDIYSISGADETSISLLYASRGINFRHIHQRYAATSWKPDWIPSGEARAFHYFGKTKPWNMHVDEYPDLLVWWNIANKLCSENEYIKNMIAPEYTLNELDIAVAEYKLVKDIQKYIVQFTSASTSASTSTSTSTSIKMNKTKLWNNAIRIFKILINNTKLHFEHTYPICSQILNNEYTYLNFIDNGFTISKLSFTKLIKDIKNMITNRIKQKPRSIKFEILANEILCGGIKVNKSTKYSQELENIINTLALDIYEIQVL
jgi:alpha-N-acetylglucosamine transferase